MIEINVIIKSIGNIEYRYINYYVFCDIPVY